MPATNSRSAPMNGSSVPQSMRSGTPASRGRMGNTSCSAKSAASSKAPGALSSYRVHRAALSVPTARGRSLSAGREVQRAVAAHRHAQQAEPRAGVEAALGEERHQLVGDHRAAVGAVVTRVVVGVAGIDRGDRERRSAVPTWSARKPVEAEQVERRRVVTALAVQADQHRQRRAGGRCPAGTKPTSRWAARAFDVEGAVSGPGSTSGIDPPVRRATGRARRSRAARRVQTPAATTRRPRRSGRAARSSERPIVLPRPHRHPRPPTRGPGRRDVARRADGYVLGVAARIASLGGIGLRRPRRVTAPGPRR